MTTRTQLLQRRAKLQALAQRGVDGERDNAQRMLAAFDAKHPELATAPPVNGERIFYIEINGFDPRLTMVLARVFFEAMKRGR